MDKDWFLVLFMIAIIVFALNAHRILSKEGFEVLRKWGRN